MTRAHLLLPSPLGLVRYDLLEEAAFLGPGPKGGLVASPAPFREAKVALKLSASGWSVHALPGEAPPEVNGKPDDGARLADGDRVRLGDQVALLRVAVAVPVAVALSRPEPAREAAPTAAAPAATVRASESAPRPRRAAPALRAEPPRSVARAATVLALFGAVLLLVAAYRAVRLLQTPPPGAAPPIPATALAPPKEVAVPRAEERARKEFEAAAERESTNGDDLAGTAELLRAIATKPEYAGTIEATRAAAHLSELWPRVAQQSLVVLKPSVDAAVHGGRYRTAIEEIDRFDSRFSGTPAAAEVAPMREAARTAARAALDALSQRVAPVMAQDATRAYRMLVSAGLELPPDLAEELASLMRQVRDLWGRPEAPSANGSEPGTGTRPGTGVGPNSGMGPTPPPVLPPAQNDQESTAKAVWTQAHADLLAKRWEAARRGYASLLKQYAGTALVSGRADAVRAGRKAADLALRGPVALLRTESEWKDGILTAEWSFDDLKSFQEDFDVEQPFPGTETANAECRSGMAILSGSTALFLKVPFDPAEVQWEADCVADEHRDYGLLAMQEGKEYRVAALDVGNTQFQLKKGAAAKVLEGHVLWLYGDGVWRDADPGTRGFVRIAQKNGNTLKPGERITVKVEMKGDQIAGEIHAKSDGADLKGKLVGDDGRGIGVVRVGAFAYGGRVGVDRLKVVGRPDAAWLAAQLDDLVKKESGPD